jgi:transposase
MGGSRPSFIPPHGPREVRDLTRSRTSLIEERSRVINRIQKLLEDATSKLASVSADLMGKSARQMLAALLEEQEDPAILAEYARARHAFQTAPVRTGPPRTPDVASPLLAQRASDPHCSPG